MSDATETRKDELAARMLLELEKPRIPEGLADRITARAIAAPQIGAADAVDVRAPTADLQPPESSSILIMPVKGRAKSTPPRWRAYAAASAAAAVLVSVGLWAGGRESPSDAPLLAKTDRPTRLSPPAGDEEESEKLADAAPRKAVAQSSEPKAAHRTEPAMAVPVALTPPPVALALDDVPGDMAPPEAAAKEEKLAQTVQQPISQSGGSAISVYGPPAPSGLGIAGSVPGQSGILSDPAQSSRGPRGAPLGPPPSTLPGSPPSRGPGPRL